MMTEDDERRLDARAFTCWAAVGEIALHLRLFKQLSGKEVEKLIEQHCLRMPPPPAVTEADLRALAALWTTYTLKDNRLNDNVPAGGVLTEAPTESEASVDSAEVLTEAPIESEAIVDWVRLLKDGPGAPLQRVPLELPALPDPDWIRFAEGLYSSVDDREESGG